MSSAAPGTAAAAKPDLVCLAEVAWGYFRTRKQFLLSRLARDWRVTYFEPPAFGRGSGMRARREGEVTVVTVPFPKPGSTVGLYNRLLDLAPARAAVEAAARRSLAGWCDRLGIERPVCLVSNIYAVRLLSALRPRLLCYDFNDHPLQFPTAPSWAERYFQELLARADLVLAVSEPYRRELVERTTAPVITLGNGVEYDRFARPAGPVPADLESLPRPRIGYLGKLSDFLDLPLLEHLAERVPHPLVLAGPIPGEMRARLEPLLAHPRVHHLGERPYEEVPAFLSGLDVALIPFRAGARYTTGIDPNKLYQYLAAGLPVVSSPIEGWTDDEAGLRFAADAASFCDAVERALAAPPDRERLRARARARDWDAIAARMDAILREHLAAGAARA